MNHSQYLLSQMEPLEKKKKPTMNVPQLTWANRKKGFPIWKMLLHILYTSIIEPTTHHSGGKKKKKIEPTTWWFGFSKVDDSLFVFFFFLVKGKASWILWLQQWAPSKCSMGYAFLAKQMLIKHCILFHIMTCSLPVVLMH